MLVGTDVCVQMVFMWEETEYPEETHLSDLVTTWPSRRLTPGIEPGSQRWEASVLTLRQPQTSTQTDIHFVTYICKESCAHGWLSVCSDISIEEQIEKEQMTNLSRLLKKGIFHKQLNSQINCVLINSDLFSFVRFIRISGWGKPPPPPQQKNHHKTMDHPRQYLCISGYNHLLLYNGTFQYSRTVFGSCNRIEL